MIYKNAFQKQSHNTVLSKLHIKNPEQADKPIRQVKEQSYYILSLQKKYRVKSVYNIFQKI